MQAYEKKEAARRELAKARRPAAPVLRGRGGPVAVPVGCGAFSTPVGGASKTPVGGASKTPVGGASKTPEGGASKTPEGGARAGAVLVGRTSSVPRSRAATGTGVEGGAAQMSGINLAGVRY